MSIATFNELLAQRIKELVPVQTVWALCKSVDWEKKVMVATGQTDDLDYEDVSLGLGWEAKKPKVGTICLLGIEENNPANAFLIDAAELKEFSVKIDKAQLTIKKEEINVKVDGSDLTIRPQGFIIKHGNETLKKVIDDLIVEKNKLNVQLQAVVVSAGVSPNVPVLQQIEADTEAVKQRLNNVLIE